MTRANPIAGKGKLDYTVPRCWQAFHCAHICPCICWLKSGHREELASRRPQQVQKLEWAATGHSHKIRCTQQTPLVSNSHWLFNTTTTSFARERLEASFGDMGVASAWEIVSNTVA